MMGLHESTRRVLHAFRDRRRAIAFSRGLCGVLVLGTLILLLGVLSDAAWPQAWIPWAVGLVFYGAMAVAISVCCLRPYMARADWLAEARRLEALDPRLRERLLASVELSQPRPGVVDSDAFRGQLHAEVARLLRGVDVRQLVPWAQTERRLALAAAACAGLLLLLCLAPGYHFPHRVARVLFPMADWGRVTRIAITLQRPLPHSQLVPRGDIVPVTARIDGPRPELVQLEIRRVAGEAGSAPTAGQHTVVEQTPPADQRSLLAMVRGDPATASRPEEQSERTSRFEYPLTVDSPVMCYRVCSEGASTPWYTLHSAPRPRVLRFERRVSLPAAYPPSRQSGSPTNAYVDAGQEGSLRVLAGSRVELRIQTDQPLRGGGLRWEDNRPMPLRRGAADDTWNIDFTVTHSGDYQLDLTSRDTGFSNAFGPVHHVEVVPDLAPEVTWLAPHLTDLLAQTTDVLQLRNAISDELPIAEAHRRVWINGQALPPQPLPNAAANEPPREAPSEAPGELPSGAMLSAHRRQSTLDWRLELAGLGVLPGDMLEVQVSVADQLGQSADSPRLAITVAATDIEAEPGYQEQQRFDVATSVDRVAQRMAALDAACREWIAAMSPASPTQNVDAISAAEHAVQVAQGEAGQAVWAAWETVLATAADSSQPLDSHVLIDVGNLLAAFNAQVAEPLPVAKRNDTGGLVRDRQQAAARQWQKQVETAAQQARELAEHSWVFATAEALSRSRRQLIQLADAAQALSAAYADDLGLGDPGAEAGQQRQRRVLAAQLNQVQRSLRETLPRVRRISQPVWQQAAQLLSQHALTLEQWPQRQPTPTPAETSALFANQATSLRTAARLDTSLAAALPDALRGLAQLAPSPAQSPRAVLAATETASPASYSDEHAAMAVRWLLLQRQLQRTAVWGDRHFAADLGHASRGLQVVTNNRGQATPKFPTAVDEIASALDILHANHTGQQVDRLLAALADVDTHATTVLGLQVRLEQLSRSLSAAALPESLRTRLDNWRHSPLAEAALRLTAESTSSGAPALDELVWRADDAHPLRQGFRGVLLELESHAQKAREVLARHAPSISQLARRAAEDVRRAADDSDQLAQSLEQLAGTDGSSQLAQWASRAAAATHSVDPLRHALADVADTQDLLDERQRGWARHAHEAHMEVEADAQLVERTVAAVVDEQHGKPQPSQLRAVGATQRQFADHLHALARHFEGLADPNASPETPPWSSPSPLPVQDIAGESAPPRDAAAEPIGDAAADATPGEAQLTEEIYRQAAQLAQLASLDPGRVLAQLEQELASDAQMADEMSRLTRHIVQRAGRELELVALLESGLSRELAMSDPQFAAHQALWEHDLQTVSQAVAQLLATLVSPAKWAAGASRKAALQQQLASVEEALREALHDAGRRSAESAHESWSAVAGPLKDALTLAAEKLFYTQQQLEQASFEELHQNGADLANRRREMRDRQQQIYQERVRDAQKLLASHQDKLQRMSAAPLSTALGDRIRRAERRLQELSSATPLPLDAVNPTAQLAAEACQLAGEENRRWAAALDNWLNTPPPHPHASLAGISQAVVQQRGAVQQLTDVRQDLLRAGRHEQRLQHDSLHQKLAQLAQATGQLLDSDSQQLMARLAAAGEEAAADAAGASAAATAAIRTAANSAAAATREVQAAVQALLAATGDGHQPATSGAADTAAQAWPLTAVQKARLLDELDQRLLAQLDLGKKEDDAPAAPSSGSVPTAGAVAGGRLMPLRDAAEQLARQLSQTRQAGARTDAASDLAMATQAGSLGVELPSAVEVRVLGVGRGPAAWGQLPQQAPEQVLHAGRERVDPVYRAQIDAYFRELAERGSETWISPTRASANGSKPAGENPR